MSTTSPVSVVDHEGYRASIYYDADPENPRQECPLGVMVGWHSRYQCGDKHSHKSPDAFLRSLVDDRVVERLDRRADTDPNFSYDEYKANLMSHVSKTGIILPVYLYDHSGVAYATSPFSCPWDSGQVGYIYLSRSDIERVFGWKVLTNARREKLMEYLTSEVKTYGKYCNGEVYAYIIEKTAMDEDGELVATEVMDSCGGYYGMDEAEKEAVACIKAIIKRSV